MILTELNKDSDLTIFMLDMFHYIDIQLDKGLVSIERRQGYCDRGRYYVKVFSECVKTFYIDDADMFPRYYFRFENLLDELDHWFKARNVNIVSIHKRSIDRDTGKVIEHG